MNKLVFLSPDSQSAAVVLEEIRKTGINNDQIHAIANADTPLDSLPDPDIAEEKDIVGGATRGALAGSATGMLAGLIAAIVPGAGLVAAGSAIAAGAIGGASFGMWIGVMVGASVPNSQLDEWQHMVDSGNVLIVLEIEDDQLDYVKSVLARQHKNVIEHGEKTEFTLI